jgi:hypothetical protein
MNCGEETFCILRRLKPEQVVGLNGKRCGTPERNEVEKLSLATLAHLTYDLLPVLGRVRRVSLFFQSRLLILFFFPSRSHLERMSGN